MAKFKVGALSYYTDGDSDERPIAIVVRQSNQLASGKKEDAIKKLSRNL